MGFGNVLYLWLQAHIDHSLGGGRQVLETPNMRRWVETFPALTAQRLTVQRNAVKFTARRDKPWLVDTGRNRYTTAQLERFCREIFLDSPLFRNSELGAGRGLESQESLTINIRRGDYYSVPVFESEFGFDQLTYLRVAITGSLRDSPKTSRIYVVSDDIDWCRKNLSWVSDLVDNVEYASPQDSPQQNMLDVASSRRLIITNSTFSYWCAYISNTIYGDNHSEIWAPRFFAWFKNSDGMSTQLDERWSIVEDIPGGWKRRY